MLLLLVFVLLAVPSCSYGLDHDDSDPKGNNCTPANSEAECGVHSICVPNPNSNSSYYCYCENDAACGSMNLICSWNHTFCEHKALWPPNVMDICSAIILLFVSALAAASGTGGGGLLVSLFIAMEDFTAREAMPLSKASIFGGAVANFIYNFTQRHPEADRPLIDFDIVGIMEPSVLLGTVVGVYAIKLLPSWIVLVLLVIVLAYTAYKTIQKGLSIYREERELDQALLDLESSEEASLSSQRNSLDIQEEKAELVKRETGVVAEEWQSAHQDEIKEIQEREAKTPWLKIGSFVLIWSCVFLVSFLKGGEGHDSLIGIECGSVGYWLLVSSVVPVFGAYTAVFGYFLKQNYDRKKEIDYPFLKSDMEWKVPVLIKLPIFGLLCGVAAGLFGIGSGMIVGPVILAYHVPPRVVSAVSAFMILFTASSTTIQFSVFGLLRYDYGGWYAGFGFVGALVGQFVIGHFIKKYNKNSIVAFILAFMIVGGALALGVMGALNIYHKAQQGGDLWALQPLCSKD